MDFLMLCQNDWANTGYRYYQSLKHLGLRGLAFKGVLHGFYYPEQMLISPYIQAKLTGDPSLSHGYMEVPELRPMAEDAKVIHFRDSGVINTGVDLYDKKVVAQHGGRFYRSKHKELNELLNPIVDVSMIHMADLMGLGAKNEQLMYFSVDTDLIQPQFRRPSKKLFIGHWPTGQIEKGTRMISALMAKLEGKYGDRFEYIGVKDTDKVREEILPWHVNLKRMAYVDIMIDACAVTAQGFPYGEWGNTAMESAASGTIVVTHCLRPEPYAREFPVEKYDPNPMFIANDQDQMEAQLVKLLEMSDKEIEIEKQKHRTWVERNHSIPAMADRLWEKVYKDLLS